MHYDRKGQPMTLEQWGKAFQETDRVVAQTDLSDGTLVSTVWLGIDHRFSGNGPPLIFETMVFPHPKRDMREADCERYPTEEEARAGHERMVAKWSPRQ